MDQNGVVMSSTKAEVRKLELPHYTKFLLIAAYLASHNDAKIDKRLFVKHHGKQKKRLQTIRSNATVSMANAMHPNKTATIRKCIQILN